MKRDRCDDATIGRCVRFAGLALLALLLPGASPAPSVKLQSVTLAIRNREFHEFEDQEVAKLNQDFPIGDTDYSGRIVQYVPDFAMDLTTRKVITRSSEPRNPAFKIIVRQKAKAVDTTWAMLSLPPHFTRRSFLAFKVMRIDFVGRAPLLADSSATAKELEALKEEARKSAPPETAMMMTGNPHGGNPHAHMHAPGTISTVPSHSSTVTAPGSGGTTHP